MKSARHEKIIELIQQHDIDTQEELAARLNMIVIRTVPGMAMGVAAALDALNWKEILGSIAGDDTVMCVARDNEQAQSVAERLKGILKLC